MAGRYFTGHRSCRGFGVAEAHLTEARPERRVEGAFRLPVEILPQPDETTCGPTCLHAVFRYWGEEEPLQTIIDRGERLEHGGTYAVFLACDALRKGYRATIYTYNITVFDPTWFRGEVDIAERLVRQRDVKASEPRLVHATNGYLEFLRLGGGLRFVDLTAELIHGILRRRLPIITGLSATYLYRSAREYGVQSVVDDVAGAPAGHFVVLAGYNADRGSLLVVDPYQPTPYGPSLAYWIAAERVMGSILLGIVTHDANLLVVHPKPVSAPEGKVWPVHFEPL
jgi:hypothetical protein